MQIYNGCQGTLVTNHTWCAMLPWVAKCSCYESIQSSASAYHKTSFSVSVAWCFQESCCNVGASRSQSWCALHGKQNKLTLCNECCSEHDRDTKPSKPPKKNGTKQAPVDMRGSLSKPHSNHWKDLRGQPKGVSSSGSDLPSGIVNYILYIIHYYYYYCYRCCYRCYYQYYYIHCIGIISKTVSASSIVLRMAKMHVAQHLCLHWMWHQWGWHIAQGSITWRTSNATASERWGLTWLHAIHYACTCLHGRAKNSTQVIQAVHVNNVYCATHGCSCAYAYSDIADDVLLLDGAPTSKRPDCTHHDGIATKRRHFGQPNSCIPNPHWDCTTPFENIEAELVVCIRVTDLWQVLACFPREWFQLPY